MPSQFGQFSDVMRRHHNANRAAMPASNVAARAGLINVGSDPADDGNAPGGSSGSPAQGTTAVVPNGPNSPTTTTTSTGTYTSCANAISILIPRVRGAQDYFDDVDVRNPATTSEDNFDDGL